MSNIKLTASGIKFIDKDGNDLSLNVAVNKIFSRIATWRDELILMLVHMVSDHIPFWSIRRAIFIFTGLKIGRSTIHMGVRFYNPKGITIGDDTIIGYRCTLDGRSRLLIGDHVDIASEVMIYNSQHDIHSDSFTAESHPVKIGDYVFLGPRVIVLPNVEIGTGAVVGAGAVVTKSLPERSVSAGIPAKQISDRHARLEYKLGRASLFC